MVNEMEQMKKETYLTLLKTIRDNSLIVNFDIPIKKLLTLTDQEVEYLTNIESSPVKAFLLRTYLNDYFKANLTKEEQEEASNIFLQADYLTEQDDYRYSSIYVIFNDSVLLKKKKALTMAHYAIEAISEDAASNVSMLATNTAFSDNDKLTEIAEIFSENDMEEELSNLIVALLCKDEILNSDDVIDTVHYILNANELQLNYIHKAMVRIPKYGISKIERFLHLMKKTTKPYQLVEGLKAFDFLDFSGYENYYAVLKKIMTADYKYQARNGRKLVSNPKLLYKECFDRVFNFILNLPEFQSDYSTIVATNPNVIFYDKVEPLVNIVGLARGLDQAHAACHIACNPYVLEADRAEKFTSYASFARNKNELEMLKIGYAICLNQLATKDTITIIRSQEDIDKAIALLEESEEKIVNKNTRFIKRKNKK